MSQHARPNGTWWWKFKIPGTGGRQQTGSGYLTKGEAADAERLAKQALRAGKLNEFRALLNPRAATILTIADIRPHYLAAPPGPRRASQAARAGNLRRLADLLRLAGQTEVERTPLSALNANLIYRFRNAIEQKAAAEDAARRLQLYRSANSTLRQARSVFSRDFCEYYREIAGLALPDLRPFQSAPAFKGCRKEEYTPPPDAVIAKTFETLAAMEKADLNLFKACWLALGYGLRKSEIEQATNGWFTTIDGAPYIAVAALAKNKRFPRIRCQLDAWSKLGPHIEGTVGSEYVLLGTTTERTDDVFRRISEWMRSLGWQTQHHVHELRAFAGCQVAMHSERGLLDAQTFLRHASITTTETCYGHHIKRHLASVSLHLPTVAPFEPKIVGQPG